ncbi:hypothetical protein ABEB36_013316 [Hypothenemus hampei]|uniref:Regulatory protein zeste n=1 Tax=Hypothenemus hampei TaxID=57062 RepID=A0ABD1E7L1_HYPHA
MSEPVKRKRATNFSEYEVAVLVDTVLEKINIIENKQSDAVTWKEKNKAWDSIATKFNALSGQINRTAKELKLKYDCIKKNIKKKQARNKFERFKTGGGEASIEELTNYEEKVLSYIALGVDGLPSENDCDAYVIENMATSKNNTSPPENNSKVDFLDSGSILESTIPVVSPNIYSLDNLDDNISNVVILEENNVVCNNDIDDTVNQWSQWNSKN